MLHFSTKMFGLLKKVTKMLNNPYHVNGYYIHITEQKIIL